MSKIRITLVKSTNSSLKKHKATVAALGLKKIGHMVEQENNDAIMGMVKTVAHLVRVEQDQGGNKE
jgi:large subunit ribosomal protein L30